MRERTGGRYGSLVLRPRGSHAARQAGRVAGGACALLDGDVARSGGTARAQKPASFLLSPGARTLMDGVEVERVGVAAPSRLRLVLCFYLRPAPNPSARAHSRKEPTAARAPPSASTPVARSRAVSAHPRTRRFLLSPASCACAGRLCSIPPPSSRPHAHTPTTMSSAVQDAIRELQEEAYSRVLKCFVNSPHTMVIRREKPVTPPPSLFSTRPSPFLISSLCH